jgi:hypothetical protein
MTKIKTPHIHTAEDGECSQVSIVIFDEADNKRYDLDVVVSEDNTVNINLFYPDGQMLTLESIGLPT